MMTPEEVQQVERGDVIAWREKPGDIPALFVCVGFDESDIPLWVNVTRMSDYSKVEMVSPK
jgi:hypothetical protein